MKFVFYEINNVFEFTNQYINTLVIENPVLFSKVIKDVSRQINGFDGLSVLSENHSTLPFQKNAELLYNFIDFDINSKSLINKIVSALEKVSLNEENYINTQSLLSEIELNISKWAFDFPCDIITSKISPAALLKAAGVEIKDNYNGSSEEAEKILDYMELVREFDKDKLFITVNMRSFFDNETMEKFINTVLSHEFKVLMIENKSNVILKGEKRFTVDEDLCEF